ncbi:hypothetical protein VCHA43P273_10333 [Vibrio chagasii]|nr:hypothetical protein VCHA29O37_10174 [Vibrio chagasii]CAH7061021.1 hypothetical protein VCHA43P273_10333 [Vibrio chagasii]
MFIGKTETVNLGQRVFNEWLITLSRLPNVSLYPASHSQTSAW